MKKLMALFTALALLLCLAVGASASVPSKPREFAYAYDYDNIGNRKTAREMYENRRRSKPRRAGLRR